MIRILDECGHPLVGEQLLTLRAVERQGNREGFRRALWRLGMWLGYEAGRLLPHRDVEVRTPLGTRSEPTLADAVVLAPVLRAGLPLWHGLLEAFPNADSLVLGARRVEGHPDPVTGRMGIDISYSSMADVAGRTLIYVDPMLATGSTLLELHPRVIAEKGLPARTLVVGVVGYRPTLDLLEAELGADIVVASADDGLDDRGYIVPGLGDAGDLAFGGA
jgi:uracil phosphoribosyltransferase